MASSYFIIFIIFFITLHHQIDLIYTVENEELKNAPPDHEIPYSEHENPPEPPTKPEYGVPGGWAKPPPEKNVPLEFVPTTMYAQVRGSHTVKRVPRKQALREASTEEEKENAGRLKEVVTNKKVNTIYTEEGYEDAAYDHAGHIRDADFREGYAKKEKDEEGLHDLLELNSSESEEDDDYDFNENNEATNVEETLIKPTLNKNKKFYPKEEFKKIWRDPEVNPRKVVEREGLKLERYLEKEAEESEKAAETDVPSNLKNLASDEGSLESPSDQIKRKFIGDSSEGVYLPTTKRPKVPLRAISTPPPPAHTTEEKIYPKYEDTTPKVYPLYQEVMATTTPHAATPDYGRVFWDYFKTKKPETVVTTEKTTPKPETTTNRQIKRIMNRGNNVFDRRSENIAQSSKDRLTARRPPESREIERQSDLSSEYSSEESSEETAKPTEYYKLTPTPVNRQSLDAPKYTTVTSPEVIQSILKNPQVAAAIKSKVYPKYNEVRGGLKENLLTTTKRPTYTVIIRAPAKPCDKPNEYPNQSYLNQNPQYLNQNSQYLNQFAMPKYEPKFEETVNNQNYGLLNHLTNNVNPKAVNNEAYSNNSLVKPPSLPPFGQVTYADYLRDTYGNNYQPGPAHESESLEESDQPSAEKPYRAVPQRYNKPPPPLPPQHPPPQQYRPLPFFSWLTNLAPMAKFILPKKMLPPSPMSRSRYAEFPIKRVGTVQQKIQPNILPFYNPPFQVNGPPVKRFKRQSLDFNEKVFSTNDKGKLLLDQLVTVKSRGYRKKRSNNDILNDAPKVAQKVIDREIESRFPDESGLSSSEELENENNDKGKVEIDVPEFDFSGNLEDIENHKIPITTTTKEPIDIEKYPFYNNDQVSSNSALRYAINPAQVPKKTLGGMEFYESRDQYLGCEDINPDLSEVTPEEEEPEPSGGPNPSPQRLRGLGDKLSCFKAKYFDKNPLDNPLFMERRVDTPQLPVELNPQRFKDRISALSSDGEAMVYRRLSRKPEITDMYPSEAKHNPNKGANHKFTHNHRVTRKRTLRKKTSSAAGNLIDTPYQKEVYEDVMGTIKNQASTMRPRSKEPRPAKRPRHMHHNLKRLPPIRQYKILPYRPDKVKYRNKPRAKSVQPAESRYNIHRKKIRLHKRSIGSDLISPVAELETNQGNWIPNRINTNRNPPPQRSFVINPLPQRQFVANPLPQRQFVITQQPQPSTITPIDTTVPSTQRVVYTIRDRIKYSKPREYTPRRSGRFPITNTTTTDPRRNEPRYANPTETPDETKHYSTTYPEVSSPEATSPEEFNNAETTTYEVKEDVVEAITAAPEVIKLKKYLETRLPGEDETTNNSTESTEATTAAYSDKNTTDRSEEEEEEEEEDKQEEESQGQQVERPSKSSDEGSSEKNEKNSASAEAYSNEEEKSDKTSEDEKDFERYAFRPTSPPEDYYDPKYAALGPRINKPAFYHPPFEVPRYERNRGKDYQASLEEEPSQKKDRKSKYVFPWERSEEEYGTSSEESRRSDYWHEYPWEKRKRLARERKLKQNDEDQHSAETGFHYEIAHPRRHFSFASSEMFDTIGSRSEYRPRSEYKPRRFSSKYHKRSDNPGAEVKKIAKSIMYYMKNNLETTPRGKFVPTTTLIPQIPPTSVTGAPKRESTTPLVEVTSKFDGPKYTVRPRSHKGRSRQYSAPIENETTVSRRVVTPTNSVSKKRIHSTTPKVSVSSSSSSVPSKRRRLRTRMTAASTTTTSAPEISSEESITKPSKRTVEHRSRVSTEERITKTSFPKLDRSKDTITSSSEDDGMQKSERVRKVSIVTKETPEHIYRTKEIDKDGVKGMFISITPNNSTDKSTDFEDDTSMNTSDMEIDIDEDAQVAEDANIPEQHRLASILAHLPPPPDWVESSGEPEDNPEIEEPKVTYIKEPDQRLYYYVEDIN